MVTKDLDTSGLQEVKILYRVDSEHGFVLEQITALLACTW